MAISAVLLQHVGRLLRDVWDPIGLGADGPVDEYDSYAPPLAALVQDMTASEAEIAANLLQIETEAMCLPPNIARATRTARALLGLREAFMRAPRVLVTQAISQDGLCCLWVFRRSDGLYDYENAGLQQTIDENGAWSWWLTTGIGQSGIFATAQAATEDAHASIGWLR